jgi:micrococcal nuclease
MDTSWKPEGHQYYCWKVLDVGYVYDGDSIKNVSFSLGFNNVSKERDLRLYGIDTPELRGEEREAGLKVRDYVINRIENALANNQEIYFYSYKDKQHKYGEIICSLWIGDACLNTELLKLGYAKHYDGGKKEEWLKEDLDKILINKI